MYVTFDTFSQAIVANALTREVVKDDTQHLVTCFFVLGIPRQIKTNNAPAYVSKAFLKFCNTMGIETPTGIP